MENWIIHYSCFNCSCPIGPYLGQYSRENSVPKETIYNYVRSVQRFYNLPVLRSKILANCIVPKMITNFLAILMPIATHFANNFLEN